MLLEVAVEVVVTEAVGAGRRAREVVEEAMMVTITVDQKAADRGDEMTDVRTGAMSVSLTVLDLVETGRQSEPLEICLVFILYGDFRKTYENVTLACVVRQNKYPQHPFLDLYGPSLFDLMSTVPSSMIVHIPLAKRSCRIFVSTF